MRRKKVQKGFFHKCKRERREREKEKGSDDIQLTVDDSCGKNLLDIV